jgi:predicted lipase
MSYDDVKSLWRMASSDPDNITAYIFEDVIEEPKYYYDCESSVNAYSWLQHKTLHIVFRGTEDRDDVKIDLNQVRSPLFLESKILVHSGFLKQFQSIKAALLNEISAHSSEIEAVHFSGHSLGAALATMAAGVFSAVIHSHGCRVICHTIGSPRLGNQEFVDWWNDKVDESWRILNFKDPVPLLPVNGFYSHIIGGLEINDKCVVKRLSKDVPWYLRLIYLPFEIYYCNPIANHACDLYISRLLQLADWDIKTI